MTPEEIKEIRKKLGMSQAEFAKRIGLSPFPVSVSRWELGKAHPSRLAIKSIRSLMEAADVAQDS